MIRCPCAGTRSTRFSPASGLCEFKETGAAHHPWLGRRLASAYSRLRRRKRAPWPRIWSAKNLFYCHGCGRSIGAAFPHRLLPRSKGGLFAWESVSSFSTVILVAGLFDLAVLWQAGFRNTTCAIGTQLTPAQLSQLAEQPRRSVYIAFDQDDNQAGQKGSRQLAQRLQGVGIRAHIVQLPHGHDPNSYFVAGATAADFTHCLERAQQL